MITENTGAATAQEIAYMADLDERLQRNPDDVDALLRKGFLFLDSFHRFDEAIEILTSIVVRYPSNVDAHLWLGECLCFRIGDTIEAERIMQAALKIDPNRADCHMVLAASFEGLCRDSDAEFHYRRASELEPTWILPRRYLANIFACRGELVKAKQELEKALLYVPDVEVFNETYDPIKEYQESFMSGQNDPAQKKMILDWIDEIDVKIAEKNKNT